MEVFGAVEALKLDLNCSIFASAQFPTIQVSGHDFIELAISTENQVKDGLAILVAYMTAFDSFEYLDTCQRHSILV